MWILVVLSLSGGMDAVGKGSFDDCVKIANDGLKKHADQIKKAWCVPEAEWRAGEGGVTDAHEIHP